MQLIFAGQKIEIGLSPGSRIQNSATGEWVVLQTDYSTSVIGDYKGIAVPVIPIVDLIAYKALLGREVDLIDIEELTQIMEKRC